MQETPTEASRGHPSELVIPALFVFAAAWVIWRMPAYIMAFGGGTDAMVARFAKAGVADWIALVACAVLFVIGVGTVRHAHMEYDGRGAFDRVSVFIGRVTMLLVVLLVAVMFFEVIMRYVFEAPTLWANELSLWIAGFVFLFSGLYAMQQRSHIRIFLVYDVMPRWLQKASDVLSTALVCVFVAALIYGGYGEAHDKFLRWETFGTAFDPPIPATLKPFVLVFATLVAIQAISNLIRDWNVAPEHHASADDIDEEEIAIMKKILRPDDDV